jgi:GTP-binding protein HflX
VEEHIKAVNEVLAEIDCDRKRTILVLNKIDKVADRSKVHILMALHPKAVAISGATGEGIDTLRDAVIEALTADFVEADVTTGMANGKVLAYLNAHAEIFRQEYRDNQVTIRCKLPKYLLHHIEGDGVEVKMVG